MFNLLVICFQGLFKYLLCIKNFFQVCREWETKAHDVDNGVRLVLIRIGIVLGKDGGALGLFNSSKCYPSYSLTFELIFMHGE